MGCGHVWSINVFVLSITSANTRDLLALFSVILNTLFRIPILDLRIFSNIVILYLYNIVFLPPQPSSPPPLI